MKSLAVIVSAALVTCTAWATGGVIVLPAAQRDGGAASIAPPMPGEYVYSSAQQPSDGRLQQRFLIKPPARTTYTLFSAQEEQALWQLRESMKPRPVAHRVAHKAAPAMAVPRAKVMVVGTRTCVPASGFADAADWRSHTVCWDKEKRNVVSGQ